MAAERPNLVQWLFHPRRWPRPVKLAVAVTGFVVACWVSWETFDWYRNRKHEAVNRLWQLIVAQEQFKQQTIVDQAGDGMGEYGWLGELSGADPCRGSGLTMNVSPFVSASLKAKDRAGRARVASYFFRLALPDGQGGWSWEKQKTKAKVMVGAANEQEAGWICYAWPADATAWSSKVYVASCTGDIYVSDNSATAYEGANGPAANAALDAAGHLPGYAVVPAATPSGGAARHTGRDGNTWVPVR